MSGDLRAEVYSDWVQRFADAIHEDCKLEWQAIATVDPGRLLTMHLRDAHYGQAHSLVRRLIPEGAVLVTEETLAAALDKTDVLNGSYYGWEADGAAAILRHLREAE